MSESKFSIELIYDTTCRPLKNIPNSIKDLINEVENEFKVSGVIFKYMDEEGDMITVSTDQELLESYEILRELQIPLFKIMIQNGPNFKQLEKDDSDIEITENYLNSVRHMVRNEMEKSIGYNRVSEPIWENVKCDGCQESPITGLRFKCTVCDDFDFCEFCEMTMQHPHPFLKLSTLDHSVNLIKVSLDNKPAKTFTKAMMMKKPKMKFVQHVSYVEGEKVKPGQVMEKIWKLKNIGNDEWPTGCKVDYVKGDLQGVGYEIGPVKSGDSIDVIASINIPPTEGRYTGVWRLFTPDGVSFGDKLYIVVQSHNEDGINEKQLNDLVELGFNREKARQALRLFPGDTQEAFKYLVNNN